MRNLTTLLLSLYITSTTAQLFPLNKNLGSKSSLDQADRTRINIQAPAPYQPLVMPQTQPGDGSESGPMLSDVIGIDKLISIFSGLTRSVESVGSRLEDGRQNTTVLAPSNPVIMNLPRKPWEDEHDEREAGIKGVLTEELYRGVGGEDRAARNLRRFVEAHMVGVSPWYKGEQNKVATLEGKEIWWDESDGVRKIFPDNIEVETVRNDVSNGQIWVLKGVINY